jgi:hypothetical protein
MLSKCANPACTARFRYLHEGRIFSAVFDAKEPVRGEEAFQETPRRVERYWLCDTCAVTMTLVISAGRVVLRPVPLPVLPSSARRGEFLAA